MAASLARSAKSVALFARYQPDTRARVPFVLFPLAASWVTWYKQFVESSSVALPDDFCATLAACLASKFQKAVIDPGHGIRIRGQSSSKGFERTSKRSFLKFKRFRLGMCRNIWPILPRKPRHIARKAFKRLNLGTSLSRERLLWHLSPPICTSNVQKLWKSCESIELTALPCAR